MKTCTRCGQDKEILEFNKDKYSPDGRTYQCKRCQQEQSDTYKRKTGQGRGSDWIAFKYGLTKPQYENLVKQANGHCQLCQRSSNRLVLDHCAKTGIVRGLLCDNCNLGIGLFNHNQLRISDAISYLVMSSKVVNLRYHIEELSKQLRQTMKGAGRLYPREGNLRKFRETYNIDPKEYDLLLQQQNHKCKICQTQTKLHIDHCHKTKQIRGLLCAQCNQGLGLFEDDLIKLAKAIDYLQKDKDKTISILGLLCQL